MLNGETRARGYAPSTAMALAERLKDIFHRLISVAVFAKGVNALLAVVPEAERNEQRWLT